MSRIEVSGRMYSCPPASSRMPLETIRLVGSLIEKTVPAPGLLRMSTAPCRLANVVAHHIHADAAAGNIGHLFRSGQPRQEDQPARLGMRHRERGFARDETLFDGFTFERFRVQTAAIVLDLNDDVARVIARPQRYPAGGLLAMCGGVLPGVPDRGRQRSLPGGPADRQFAPEWSCPTRRFRLPQPAATSFPRLRARSRTSRGKR